MWALSSALSKCDEAHVTQALHKHLLISQPINAHGESINNSVSTTVWICKAFVVSVMILWTSEENERALCTSYIACTVTVLPWKITVSCMSRTEVRASLRVSSVNRVAWVGSVFLAWFNDAETVWCGSELAQVLQFSMPGGTGSPPARKNNARRYTHTWPRLILQEDCPCDKVAWQRRGDSKAANSALPASAHLWGRQMCCSVASRMPRNNQL